MKNYSSNRAQKGKTAYRTPSGYRAGRSEQLKRNPRLSQSGRMAGWKGTTQSNHYGGRHS